MVKIFNQELKTTIEEHSSEAYGRSHLVTLCLLGGQVVHGLFLDAPAECDFFLFEGSLVSKDIKNFTIFTIRYSAVMAWTKADTPAKD